MEVRGKGWAGWLYCGFQVLSSVVKRCGIKAFGFKTLTSSWFVHCTLYFVLAEFFDILGKHIFSKLEKPRGCAKAPRVGRFLKLIRAHGGCLGSERR